MCRWMCVLGVYVNAEPTRNLPEPPGTIPGTLTENRNNKNQTKRSSFASKRREQDGLWLTEWESFPGQNKIQKRGSKRRFINVCWGVAKFIKSQPKLNKVTHETPFFSQVSTYGFTFLWQTLQFSTCCGWLDLTKYVSVWWRVATALSCTYQMARA